MRLFLNLWVIWRETKRNFCEISEEKKENYTKYRLIKQFSDLWTQIGMQNSRRTYDREGAKFGGHALRKSIRHRQKLRLLRRRKYIATGYVCKTTVKVKSAHFCHNFAKSESNMAPKITQIWNKIDRKKKRKKFRYR